MEQDITNQNNTDKKWKALNWPWEFEILILAILLSFVAYANHVENQQLAVNKSIDAQVEDAENKRKAAQVVGPDEEGWQPIKEITKAGEPIDPNAASKAALEEERLNPAWVPFIKGMTRNSWFLVLGLIYLAHLVLSRFSPNFVSTSLWMMMAPMVFTFLGYTYLMYTYTWNGTPKAFVPRFSYAQLVSLMAMVYFISFMLARVRMQRVAIRLKGAEWIVELPPAIAKGQTFKLLARIQPIFYAPRRYKLAKEGLLIEGWHYVITIPMQEIKNIRNRDEGAIVGPGFYVVRTMEELIQLDIFFDEHPIIIGPTKHDYFLGKARETLLEFKKRPHVNKDAA
ncbi:MAG: hypothetical protein ACI9TH_002079 [Kiritimatiellia bacterium]